MKAVSEYPSILAETLAALPPRDIRSQDGAWGAQYGAFATAASYAGLATEPAARWGEWQHGWKHPYENMHPEWVAGSSGRTLQRLGWRHRLWVFRQDQADYLRSCGASHVRAIGSPMIYVPRPKVTRVPGSLLVMPPHTLRGVHTEWDADQYIEFVAGLRDQFSVIAACVTPACLAQGLWADDCRRIGVPVIEGADVRDRNSLARMAILLSAFEYVTMPTRGSQLAYAAYWGARPSIAGPAPLERVSSRADLTFYRNVPEALAIVEHMATPNALQAIAAPFLVSPSAAPAAREWGEFQLGLRHRLTPDELRSEFRWTRPWLGFAAVRRLRDSLRASQ